MRNFTDIKTLAALFLALLFLGPGSAFSQTPPPPEQLENLQEGTLQVIDPETFSFGIIERISVVGNQRIEGTTIISYLTVHVGDEFKPETIDASLKSLFNTGLFADVTMERNLNTLIIRVIENPVINRVVFEGNSRLKEDDFAEEVELRPRMIYTRAKVRSDVQRILELYRRSGRFAAVVDPKVVQQDENRVDLIFEISEGPKSRVSKINFVGNKAFSDRKLRGEVATNESRWWKFLTSNDTYDPDRMAYDREQVRKFYLDNGYADVRITSAVAELTPDQRDFFVTYVIDEGEVYTFGEITVVSEIKALPEGFLTGFLHPKTGKIYNASQIEDTIESLTTAAGVLGFAFLDVRPDVTRDRENRVISIVFRILQAPRTYVERIDIHGNVRTLDRVIRREFRLAEGDAFNSLRVDRSEQRINLLGFFRTATIEQLPGSAPDKVILDVTVEEQPTGEFSLGFGFSSFDGFIFDTSVSERNLLGKGQELTLSFLLSGRRQNITLAFTQPYFLGRNMAAGFNIFRSTFENREAGFENQSTGATFLVRFPLAEYIQLSPRYTLRQDKIKIPSGFIISPFLSESLGTNTTSAIGYTVSYVNVDDLKFPSKGQRVLFSMDFAGLGGNIHYIRTTMEADYYHPITGKWVAHLGLEAGYIVGLGQRVRINDRFFLGNPRFRGFDVAGVGPFDALTNQFLGGNIYYVGTAGVLIPLGDFGEELGFQLSAYVDVGTLYNAELPLFDQNGDPIITDFVVDSSALRMSVGIGLTWDSPFGPVRLDVAKAIMKQPFDRTQTIQFNVGTRF